MNTEDLDQQFWTMFFVGSSETRQNWYTDLSREERAYIHDYAARIGGHISKWLNAISMPVAVQYPADWIPSRNSLGEIVVTPTPPKRKGWFSP